ncbi:MAG TPA: hypothetical protein VF459_05495 [Caulobacteraceae bacterium]
MKPSGAVSRRLSFPAVSLPVMSLPVVSLAALVAGAPPAPAEDTRKPSRKLKRLGLIFAALGLAAAPLVALAVR